MNNLTICVIYKARGKGEREKYVSELKSSGVLDAILSENGCLAYEYFYSDKDENTLVLFEKWENSECQKIHMSMPDGSETNQFWNGQKSRLLR